MSDLRRLPHAGRYSVLLADPPWAFEIFSGETMTPHRCAEDHYRTMTLEELQALPVGEVAAADCALFMWIVGPTSSCSAAGRGRAGTSGATRSASSIDGRRPMPDGYPLAGAAVRTAAVVDRTMGAPSWARAARAWLALVEPRLGPARDDEGVADHLLLVGASAKYWQRLCRVFGQVGLGD